ncbi:MAG TPA: LuxR C-terminal-related transcriptional regulator [Candidatus Acidoferrales bacterium]|nr:LuxR C-terminal-related transcriptional regulator [Candidatus Acidoferrales bacterium]
MKSIRSLFGSRESDRDSKKLERLKPQYYVFCDRKSGTVRFRVDADEHGRLPLERAASLLAIYCLSHHCSPEELALVFGAGEDLVESVTARAAMLLECAGVGTSNVSLSRREQEVLQAVTQNLANKEIAARLGVSERTIKFHVSALLAKFGARNRVELTQFSTARNMPPGLVQAIDHHAEPSFRPAPRALPSSASPHSSRVSGVPSRPATALG